MKRFFSWAFTLVLVVICSVTLFSGYSYASVTDSSIEPINKNYEFLQTLLPNHSENLKRGRPYLQAAKSRSFGNVITVGWTPSSTSPSLTVEVTSGGSLLKSLIFDGTGEQTFNVAQGETVTAKGDFVAVFNGDGKSGTLTANSFNWAINGQKGSFIGDIGTW